jgi:hypothetical protein
VAQNMFILPYIRSLLNPADFFTKALPVYRHNELASLYVSCFLPPQPLFPITILLLIFILFFSFFVPSRSLGLPVPSPLLHPRRSLPTCFPTFSPPRMPSPLRRPTSDLQRFLPALIPSLSSGAGVLMHSIIPYS